MSLVWKNLCLRFLAFYVPNTRLQFFLLRTPLTLTVDTAQLMSSVKQDISRSLSGLRSECDIPQQSDFPEASCDGARLHNVYRAFHPCEYSLRFRPKISMKRDVEVHYELEGDSQSSAGRQLLDSIDRADKGSGVMIHKVQFFMIYGTHNNESKGKR